MHINWIMSKISVAGLSPKTSHTPLLSSQTKKWRGGEEPEWGKARETGHPSSEQLWTWGHSTFKTLERHVMDVQGAGGLQRETYWGEGKKDRWSLDFTQSNGGHYRVMKHSWHGQICISAKSPWLQRGHRRGEWGQADSGCRQAGPARAVRGGEPANLGGGGPFGSESWLCLTMTRWPWADYCTFLCLSFPISEMWIMIIPTYIPSSSPLHL